MRYALSILGVVCALTFVLTHGIVVVTGESMRPTLARGDLVVYRRTDTAGAGEVVLFAREEGGLVVHRVVAPDAHGTLRTKGDANASADFAPLPSERLRGRIVLRIPFGSMAAEACEGLCYTSQSVTQ